MTAFSYWGWTLDLLDHPYNSTRLNERAVEIPVALAWLADQLGDGLEVGNVLGHYGAPPRRVVDRFEQAEGVENIDVLDIGGAFDWIVAISTLEHVRWDEPPRRAGGAVEAIEHLLGLLRPCGAMLATVPLGWNAALDQAIMRGELGCSRACTLVRSGDGWEQTAEPEWRAYGVTQPWAQAVWIGEWDR